MVKLHYKKLLFTVDIAQKNRPFSESVWCPGQDSNLHTHDRRYHLKVVRLPISPPGQKALYAEVNFL